MIEKQIRLTNGLLLQFISVEHGAQQFLSRPDEVRYQYWNGELRSWQGGNACVPIAPAGHYWKVEATFQHLTPWQAQALVMHEGRPVDANDGFRLFVELMRAAELPIDWNYLILSAHAIQ